MAVKGFKGKFRFLSNFYKCNIEYEGTTYPTAEHAFQAAKTSDKNERKRILSSKNPVIAKRLGRKVTLRSDWEQVKVGILTEILRRKFQNPEMKKQLIATGKDKIIEENRWHDKYWGICMCKRCGGCGDNNLGKILQQIRSELLSTGD